MRWPLTVIGRSEISVLTQKLFDISVSWTITFVGGKITTADVTAVTSVLTHRTATGESDIFSR
jgi:hypothetical protein